MTIRVLFSRLTAALLLVLAIFATSIAFAQKPLLASLRQNVVFLGMTNPISIMLENCGCNDVQVSTDNGTIKRYGDCSYDFTPARLGMAQVIVRKRGAKGSSNILLRVVAKPKPVASIAKIAGGSIRKNVLDFQNGLMAGWVDYDFKTEFKVERFMITIMRDSKILFTRTNKGARFEEEIARWIKSTKPGDKILVYDIDAKSSDNNIVRLDPLEFAVTN
jgi:hypothetical protein